MEKQPKILILENGEGHAAALIAELDRQGVPCDSVKVERHDTFLRALDADRADLILAEHSAASSNAFSVLEAVRERHPQIPVIVLTSSCDPGLLVEIFESGAVGYVRKQRPEDLAPAVILALASPPETDSINEGVIIEENPVRREPTAVPRATRCHQAQAVCPCCKRISNRLGQWERLEVYLRYNQQATIALGVCPDCAQTKVSD